VRDEKMLEKLTAHSIQDVTELFTLVDKCARAAKFRAWQRWRWMAIPTQGPSLKVATTTTRTRTRVRRRRHAAIKGAPTTVATVAGGGRGPRGDKGPHQAFSSDDSGARYSVRNFMRHNASECREIKKLAEQFHKK
jgi:hypothetical protein